MSFGDPDNFKKPETWCPVEGCVAHRSVPHDCPATVRNGICYRPRSRAENVRAFHVHKNQPVRMRPIETSEEETRFCVGLIIEEGVKELFEACFDLNAADELDLSVALDLLDNLKNECRVKIDLEKLVDSLEDTDYVVEGFRAYLGIDGDPIHALVHAKNMEKIHDPDGKKAIKPIGWKPADLRAELIRQGWNPPGK